MRTEKDNNIIFSLTTFNRPDYALTSIGRLFDVLPSRQTIVIKDDASDDEKIVPFLSLLKQEKHEKHNLYVNRNDTNIGVDENNVTRLTCFPSFFLGSYVCLTDDDVEYSSQYFNEVIRMREYMEKNPNVFAGTLFHSINNGRHTKAGDLTEGYIVKRSFGGVSIIMRIFDFVSAMAFYKSGNYKGTPGWDFALCYFAQEVQNKLLISTPVSYVQHIGTTGVNSHPNCYDYAETFIK